MQRIFLPPEQFANGTARIARNDHLHLTRVMRARVEERVILLDGHGQAFEAVIEEIAKAETTARIVGPYAMPPEPPVFLTVAQALGKGDKFEQVIQHGTEAGASAFVPVRAERSVVEIPVAKVVERLTRWRQIAKGAAEQSGRNRIPTIGEPQTLARLARQAEEAQTPLLLLHPDSETIPLREALKQNFGAARFVLAIGPEGGWSPAEVLAVRSSNKASVTLGPRILRTETAALVAISQILYAAGE